MPSHKENKNINYTPQQIVDLVMDIEKYPEFLPWCVGAKITKIVDKNNLEADLGISFKGFFQKYSSRVSLIEIEKDSFEIRAHAIDGPFKNLTNLWHIKKCTQTPDMTYVDFFIDFEFNSIMLNKMMGPFFQKATNKMISAFEERAKELYWQKTKPLNTNL